MLDLTHRFVVRRNREERLAGLHLRRDRAGVGPLLGFAPLERPYSDARFSLAFAHDILEHWFIGDNGDPHFELMAQGIATVTRSVSIDPSKYGAAAPLAEEIVDLARAANRLGRGLRVPTPPTDFPENAAAEAFLEWMRQHDEVIPAKALRYSQLEALDLEELGLAAAPHLPIVSPLCDIYGWIWHGRQWGLARYGGVDRMRLKHLFEALVEIGTILGFNESESAVWTSGTFWAPERTQIEVVTTMSPMAARLTVTYPDGSADHLTLSPTDTDVEVRLLSRHRKDSRLRQRLPATSPNIHAR